MDIERTMMNNDTNRLDTDILDAETRENIPRVLWMDEFEEKKDSGRNRISLTQCEE